MLQEAYRSGNYAPILLPNSAKATARNPPNAALNTRLEGHRLAAGLMRSGKANGLCKQEWQTKADALKKRANLLQTAVDRLTAFMDKVLRTQKKRTDPGRPSSTSSLTDQTSLEHASQLTQFDSGSPKSSPARACQRTPPRVWFMIKLDRHFRQVGRAWVYLSFRLSGECAALAGSYLPNGDWTWPVPRTLKQLYISSQEK